MASLGWRRGGVRSIPLPAPRGLAVTHVRARAGGEEAAATGAHRGL